MSRKLFGIFSGTHLTILTLGAMLIPGAVYAVPAFTNVAIEDPSTGSRAFVTASRAISVYDAIAGYKNNPANDVNVEAYGPYIGCETIYTPPTGMALVISSAIFQELQNSGEDSL